MPDAPLVRYRALHEAMLQGRVRACHDLSEGGLALALADMALAGRLGVNVTLPETDLDSADYLFSESNGRMLVEVSPTDADRFEAHFAGQTLVQLGQVAEHGWMVVNDEMDTLIDLPVGSLVQAWKGEPRSA